jgi:hypothetical protein
MQLIRNAKVKRIISKNYNFLGARGSVMVEALCYKPEGHGFKTRWDQWIFSLVYLILPAVLGPGVYSASDRIGYHKQMKLFLGSRAHGGCVGLTTSQPSMSRFSRQGGILNISQSYKPPRPVTRIALLLLWSPPSYSSFKDLALSHLPAKVCFTRRKENDWLDE